MSRKSSKKIGKVILWVFIGLLAFNTTVSGLLCVPAVQTFVVGKVTEALSEQWGSGFSIEKVRISPTLKVTAHGVHIKDHHGNDMIFGATVKGRLRGLSLKPLKLKFGNLYLDQGKVTLRTYAHEKDINIAIWANKLSKKDKPKSQFLLYARKLHLKGTTFTLINDDDRLVFNTRNHPDIDFAFLELSDINLIMKDFQVFADKIVTISGHFDNLALKHYGGFDIQQCSGDFSICDTALIFQNCRMKTPGSNLDMDLQFLYRDWTCYGDFVDSIYIKASIRPSTLNMRDVASWAPALKGMDETFAIRTDRFKGTVNDFKLINLQAQWGMLTKVNADLAIRNVTDFNHASINLQLDSSSVNVPNLANFTLPKGKTIPIPAAVKKFGTTTLDGSFIGNPSVFDADITANSAIGKIFANLSTNQANNRLTFEGDVTTHNLNLKQLANNTRALGYGDLFVSIEGSMNGNSLTAENFKTATANITGDISRLDLLGYPLRNITLSGDYANNLYDCTVSSSDPHLACDILAQLDLTQSQPQLQGNVSLDHCDAGAIASQLPRVDSATAKGLDKFIYSLQQDPNAEMSFDNFNIVLRGHDFSDLNGYAGCDNIRIRSNDSDIANDRLRLTAINTDQLHKFILSSNIASASLESSFPIEQTIDTLKAIAHSYFPTLVSTPVRKQTHDLTTERNGHLHLQMTTDRIYKLTRIFIPDVFIASNTRIDINLNTDLSTNSVQLDLPYLGIKRKMAIHNLHLVADAQNAPNILLQLHSDSATLKLDETTLSFNELKFKAGSTPREVAYDFQWKNPFNTDTSLISKLAGDVRIASTRDLALHLHNSMLYLNDLCWKFNNENAIHFLGDSIRFNNLALSNEHSRIALDGAYSKSEHDRLKITLNNVDMGIANPFLGDISFGGKLSADATLTTRSKRTVVFGKTLAKDFTFNDETLGDLFLIAGLDTAGKVRFSGGVFNLPKELAKGRTLDNYDFQDFLNEKKVIARLKGAYGDQRLEAHATFDTLRAGFVATFLSGFSDKFTGNASGKLSFYATPDSTFFEGTVHANDINMGIAPLGTVYNIQDQDIIFNSKGIFFNQLRLFDNEHNVAYMNGSIRHNFFRNMKINLAIHTDRIMALNTPKTPVSVFYGKGFVSGDVHIQGDENEISFKGDHLKTLSGTDIVLQVTSANTISQSNAIHFKPRETAETSNTQAMFNTQSSSTALKFDFDFDVTNESEVQLYLEAIGGLMKARVDGNLQLTYNDNDDLNLYGNAIIHTGEFKLALFNLVNSRFTLVPGGTIRFDGPLEEMTTSISAYKSSKTSLASIIPQDLLSGNSTNVNAYIHLSGPLMTRIEPTFSFTLPNSTEEVRNSFYTAIDTSNKENITKQFAYFLVTNSFMPENMFSNEGSTDNVPGLGMFRNILNSLIASMIDSKKGSFGLTYNQATETSAAEYGVNASANLLKDRISLETSIGYYDDATTSGWNSMYGDFTVEYRINKAGTWRLKAYTNIGDRDEYQYRYDSQINYTAGVALAYKQDFNIVRRKGKNKKTNKNEKQ